ncbi:MAG: DUF47 family protein [Pseudomonadota bacterium]
MFKKFLPREDRFFTLFKHHAKAVVDGIDLFELLFLDYSKRDELASRIKKKENNADDIAHEIYELLNRVFVTPFDREDIRALTNHMDDIIDMVEKAGTRMEIYNISSPPDAARQLARILKDAFAKLAEAIGMLSDLKQKEKILKICIDVNHIENQGDAVLRQALKILFENPSDPFQLMKEKEIYELLEEAIDRCEDLANVIETILIKYA